MMFGMDVKIEYDPRPVLTAEEKATKRILRKRIFEISRDAKASIITSDEPSPEGTPPHTRGERGQNYRTAIRYDAGDVDAVSGPIASAIGEVGFAHEFGEEFKGEEFEERPTMWPALERNAPKFGDDFDGAIGE